MISLLRGVFFPHRSLNATKTNAIIKIISKYNHNFATIKPLQKEALYWRDFGGSMTSYKIGLAPRFFPIGFIDLNVSGSNAITILNSFVPDNEAAIMPFPLPYSSTAVVLVGQTCS